MPTVCREWNGYIFGVAWYFAHWHDDSLKKISVVVYQHFSLTNAIRKVQTTRRINIAKISRAVNADETLPFRKCSFAGC